jgi:Acetyltransferases
MHTNTVLHALPRPLSVTLRRAASADLPAVLALLAEAAGWLNERGVRQWPVGGFPASRIEPLIAAGTLYVLEAAGDALPGGAGDAAGAPAILATIALDGYADPEFWTPGDRPEAAYYVHKLCTARACAGLGLGRALLDWAGLRTLADGLPWLRLDCAKANPALQDFYRAAGFRHVRTVDLPHRASGALFQRPSAMRTGPDEVRVIDLTNDLPIADTPIRDTAIRGTAGDLVLTR